MSDEKYDVLVVGAGLFGAVIAYELGKAGKRVLVVERRNHIGGNCHSFQEKGIEIHAYGPHVVHTNEERLWRYFEQFGRFDRCMIAPLANHYGELYNLPFNMNTFYKLWGTSTPQEAREVIAAQRVPCEHPRNLEEHVLNMVGCDIYEKLVKGYTEKQYGKPCTELPASLIGRMPLLFTYENDYLRKRYQGVPVEGYDALFERMLARAEVRLGVDFLDDRLELERAAKHVVYTGAIDEYYDYRFGPLEYRGRRFETEVLRTENYQGCALVNYTDSETPWLRIIEHKHFNHDESEVTVVTKEYATDWNPGEDPYYPLENDANAEAYRRYFELSRSHGHIWFGGRLGEYRYYDMAETVRSALNLARKLGEAA